MQEETIYEMRMTAEEVLELARGDIFRTEAVVEAAQDGLPLAGSEESWLSSRGITFSHHGRRDLSLAIHA